MMRTKSLLSSMIILLLVGESQLCLVPRPLIAFVAVMKESDMNSAPLEWQASRASYELVNGFLMRRLQLEPEQGFSTNTGKNPVDLDETVSLTSKCMVPAFELVIIHSRTQ